MLIIVVGFAIYLNSTFNGANTTTGVSTGNAGSSTLSGSTSVNTTQSTTCKCNATTTTSSTTKVSSSTSVSTLGTSTIIFPQGANFQVQSSYDCVAGHFVHAFDVTSTSNLEGGINVTSPGVTVYVSTNLQAQTTNLGHPTQWVYSTNVTNSATFNITLQSGSYVIWIEGADLGCGATIVTPLEQLTFVTVTQAVMLTPEAQIN